MARKNRLVVEDGLYHITARVAHKERLLVDGGFKSMIIGWIYDIASFSGIDVYSWNIMDNHLHIYVHVPLVPEQYWITTSLKGTVPTAESQDKGMRIAPNTVALSMRPAENRVPRWTPDLLDRNYPITPAGECPSEKAIIAALREGRPVAYVPRPPTGFTMSDEEIIGRLRFLYKPEVVEKIAARWSMARAAGRGNLVDEEKDSYCRRMYNISQYMKTLKQRITQVYNKLYKHEGQLWDGRFYSVLIDGDDALAKLYVTSYIELNSYRTKKKIAPKDWKWCSYANALGDGPLAKRVREGYEKLFGVGWEEVVRRFEAVFAAEMPEKYDETGNDFKGLETMAQVVKVPCRMFERGGFISRRMNFAQQVLSAFSPKFPTVGTGSIRFFSKFDWRAA